MEEVHQHLNNPYIFTPPGITEEAAANFEEELPGFSVGMNNESGLILLQLFWNNVLGYLLLLVWF